MSASRRRITARHPLSLVLAAGMLAACANTVDIHYKHLSNFYLYDDDPTTPNSTGSPGTSGLYGVYKVTAIDNTRSGAKDFTFDVAKIYGGNDPNINTNAITPSAWVNSIQTTINISAGSKVSQVPPLGCVVILQPNANPVTNKEAFFSINYHSSAGESVLMVADPEPSQQKPTFFQAIVTPQVKPPCN